MNQRLTPYVQRLLLLNIGLFVLANFLTSLDLDNKLALHGIYSDYFVPYQFVTYMFMHAGFMHLFGNMLGLYFFGPLLEYFLGAKKFLILYFVCGIGSGLLSWGVNAYEVQNIRADAVAYIQSPDPDAYNVFINDHFKRGHNIPQIENSIENYTADPENQTYISESVQYVRDITAGQSNYALVGASGSIFGILMAFALLFPNTELVLLFPPIPIKAKYLVGAYAAFEIYSLYSNRPDDNVAHFAHLTGMIFAFILIRFWKTKRNSFY
ncbi:rhomboid family intramembrane serine protease [Cytophaga aurantiaca]|uniref:rhomboid family intramembrane serine protease n=1 Tax=Cytophaga aurantiaca TaxID=29530 RepID=UPI00035F15C6|nr:rhomboid family intramembrane serine protease [Cytophaga aurantiaca]